MYSNKILEKEDDIQESDLEEVEITFGFKFPTSIREHYLMYNGGYPEKSLFVGADNSEHIVEFFIPVKNEERSLLSILTLLDDEQIKPVWLIPFADEDGGNLFCFSIREKDNGAIYYYNHEFDYGEDPEDYIEYLSDSLPNFINSLIEYEEEE
ncbi:SMI1/KNR4 family protein [Bacillus spongiae]|uniref:SMI1/KNR4 family protein n=1 Tax=Bacillus spongiae TaxID=2683610 RepID=A0ABU8HDI6_9BACI